MSLQDQLKAVTEEINFFTHEAEKKLSFLNGQKTLLEKLIAEKDKETSQVAVGTPTIVQEVQ